MSTKVMSRHFIYSAKGPKVCQENISHTITPPPF